MTIIVATPTVITEPATERTIHALYSNTNWYTPECGVTGEWNVPFWVGGVNCPDCLAALPIGAAAIAKNGAR